MGLPRRKNIRLRDYDYSQNGVYFVTICTYQRDCLFGEIVGVDAHIDPQIQQQPYEILLSKYGEIAKKYIDNINGIDKYVIMPNHIHLIIIIDNYVEINGRVDVGIDPYIQPLSQRIKSFKTLVTKEVGVKIWQRNYHEHIIRNEPEYRKIWEYIDTNPLKWSDDRYYI